MILVSRLFLKRFQVFLHSAGNFKHHGIYFKLLLCRDLGLKYVSSSSYCCKTLRLPVDQHHHDHTHFDFEQFITADLESGRLSSVFHRLCAANDVSLRVLNKRTWGSLFYCLNKNEEYDKMEIIKERMKDLDINLGEGAYTTLIYSYIKRERVAEAKNILNFMKKNGLLRHSRTYYPVITCLANNGYQEEAFDLFEEMQQYIFKSNKNVSLAIPSSMAVSLIMSCMPDQRKKKFSEKHEKEKYKKAKNVLLFYNQSGWPMTLDIIEATKKWLTCDPANTWHIDECEISENGLCNNCHEFLKTGEMLRNDNYKIMQKNILNKIQEIFQEKQDKKLLHFKRYQEFLNTYGPYDVIIDGMNIGLSSSRKKQSKKFNTKLLHQVLKHFIHEGKKTLVVVNTSVAPVPFMKNQFYVSDVGYDDLYIIYACAFSSLKSVIVSRDKLREHRFLLTFKDRSHYLQWIRLNTIQVESYKGVLTFKAMHYDHVVQEGKTGWHFPSISGKWFCAQKTEHP